MSTLIQRALAAHHAKALSAQQALREFDRLRHEGEEVAIAVAKRILGEEIARESIVVSFDDFAIAVSGIGFRFETELSVFVFNVQPAADAPLNHKWDAETCFLTAHTPLMLGRWEVKDDADFGEYLATVVLPELRPDMLRPQPKPNTRKGKK